MKEKIYKIIANHCDQDCTDKKCTYCEENVEQILELVLNEIVIEKRKHDTTECTDEKCIVLQRIVGFNQCINELEEIKNKLNKQYGQN
jgi:hypothetical protein